VTVRHLKHHLAQIRKRL